MVPKVPLPTFTAGPAEAVIEVPFFRDNERTIPAGKVRIVEYPEGGRATWRMIAVDLNGKELGTRISPVTPETDRVVDFFTAAAKKAHLA